MYIKFVQNLITMFVHLFKLHIACNSNVLFEKKATIVDSKIIFIYLLDIVNSSSIHCFHPFPKLNLHYTLHQSKLFPSYMCLCVYIYIYTYIYTYTQYKYLDNISVS